MYVGRDWRNTDRPCWYDILTGHELAIWTRYLSLLLLLTVQSFNDTHLQSEDYA